MCILKWLDLVHKTVGIICGVFTLYIGITTRISARKGKIKRNAKNDVPKD